MTTAAPTTPSPAARRFDARRGLSSTLYGVAILLLAVLALLPGFAAFASPFSRAATGQVDGITAILLSALVAVIAIAVLPSTVARRFGGVAALVFYVAGFEVSDLLARQGVSGPQIDGVRFLVPLVALLAARLIGEGVAPRAWFSLAVALVGVPWNFVVGQIDASLSQAIAAPNGDGIVPELMDTASGVADLVSVVLGLGLPLAVGLLIARWLDTGRSARRAAWLDAAAAAPVSGGSAIGYPAASAEAAEPVTTVPAEAAGARPARTPRQWLAVGLGFFAIACVFAAVYVWRFTPGFDDFGWVVALIAIGVLAFVISLRVGRNSAP